jgi:hypothetical protein
MLGVRDPAAQDLLGAPKVTLLQRVVNLPVTRHARRSPNGFGLPLDAACGPACLSPRLENPFADHATKEEPSADTLDMDSYVLHEQHFHSLASSNRRPWNHESRMQEPKREKDR